MRAQEFVMRQSPKAKPVREEDARPEERPSIWVRSDGWRQRSGRMG